MNSSKSKLDDLLNSYSDEFKNFQNNAEITFDKAKTEGILLFGSGGFGKKTLKGLQKIGIEPLGFVDRNPGLWGKSVEGISVFSPEEAVTKYPHAIYTVTIWSDKIGHPIAEVRSLLDNFSAVTVTSFFWLYYLYPETFLPYFSLDIPAKTIEQTSLVYEAFSLFEDELSRTEYIAQLRMRFKGDVPGLGNAVGPKFHFFNDIFELNNDDVIVDIGAFDGDTLKDFLSIHQGNFKKYFAFEPDPENFKKLEKHIKDLSPDLSEKITAEQMAVSDKEKEISFDAEGSLQSAYNEQGNIKVKCISLDEYCSSQYPTYIKVDAEGAEPDILKGAMKIIREAHPILAISVYHQFDHLWSLPLAIKEISADYSFYLRPLCAVSWDLICYAVPKQRIKH